MFANVSHESPKAQEKSIRTSNQKAIRSTRLRQIVLLKVTYYATSTACIFLKLCQLCSFFKIMSMLAQKADTAS